MTLKELLNKCDFKDIAPFIAQNYPEEAGGMPHFKIAFDILQQMTPKLNPDYPSYQEIELSAKLYEKWERKGMEKDYYIRVTCGGDYPESDLAKEIVVSDGLTLTDNEIAAHCLWEMTFFGFTKRLDEAHQYKHNTGVDTSNPYAVAAEKLQKKLQKNQEKRIKQLERMAKVENTIRELTADTNFTREELQYLFKTNLIYEDKYHSCAYNVQQRIEYLIDLFSNYQTKDFSNFTHFLVVFRTSSAFPLSTTELEKIQDFFSRYLPASANIRLGYGIFEGLETEVGVMVVGSY
ncbi:MAG: hypothetical protein LBU83_01950 [Bacteroidales bacterium]|jgi:F0F1-type ATP synthase delta subunit|nr:hypothetical protein [Bacteroidales bacterium]